MTIAGPIVRAQWGVPTVQGNLLKALGKSVPNPVAGHMLIDTGAAKTCIAEDVAIELGLKPIGKARTFGAHGQGEANKYVAHFSFSIKNKSSNLLIEREMITAAIPQLNEAYSVFSVRDGEDDPVRLIGLLGRDFLQHTKLVYDGIRGSYSIAMSLESMNRKHHSK